MSSRSSRYDWQQGQALREPSATFQSRSEARGTGARPPCRVSMSPNPRPRSVAITTTGGTCLPACKALTIRDPQPCGAREPACVLELVQGDIDKTVDGRIGINAHLLQARLDVGIVVTLDLGVQDGTWVDDRDSHGRILRSRRGCPAPASTVSVLEQDGHRVRERPSELGEWRLRQRPCPKQEGTFSTASCHTLDQLDSCFGHGVASAGLLPATLVSGWGSMPPSMSWSTLATVLVPTGRAARCSPCCTRW
jgi:hypothetical protein